MAEKALEGGADAADDGEVAAPLPTEEAVLHAESTSGNTTAKTSRRSFDLTEAVPFTPVDRGRPVQESARGVISTVAACGPAETIGGR